MTTRDFVRLANSVSLSRMPVRLQVRAEFDPEGVSVTVGLAVNDRSTGDPITVYRSEVLPGGHVAQMSRIDAIHWLNRLVKDHVCHEVDECFLVDGQRVFDPHAHERKERAA